MSDKELQTLLRTVARMDHKLTELLNKPKQQTWVKVGVVKEMTGWTKEKMRRYRATNIIKFRKSGNGFEYLLESIPEMFINKQTA